MAKERWYRFYLYLLLESVFLFFVILPRSAVQWIGACFGRFAFWLLSEQRRNTISHLRTAFGAEKTEPEIFQIARSTFIQMGRTGGDILWMPRVNRHFFERVVDPGDGLERLKKALAKKRGVILLTAHIGNWEFVGAYVRHMGFEGQAVARRLYYEPYNRILVRLRQKGRTGTIYHDESPRAVLSLLHSGQIVGMLADQDIDRIEGVFVPFFGKETWTPTAPVRIALASGAVLLPAFMVREGSRYRFCVEDPIEVPGSGSKEEIIRTMTIRWSQVVERYIRQFPDQWVWMHDRWRTTPEKMKKQERISSL